MKWCLKLHKRLKLNWKVNHQAVTSYLKLILKLYLIALSKVKSKSKEPVDKSKKTMKNK